MKNHRSTIVGFGVLIVLMTAGAAQSLSGSNTVYTDDIVNNHVTNADLGGNSVSRSKVVDNAIAGPEVLNDSLTGSDINESSLAAVCPEGLTRLGDLCYGGRVFLIGWGAVLGQCADVGLRLPSVSEAMQISLAITTGPSDVTDKIWTNGIYKNHADNQYHAIVVNDAGAQALSVNEGAFKICMTTVGSRP